MSLYIGYESNLEYVEENIDMDGNRILDLPDPVEDDEPVTKGYADKHYSGSGAQSINQSELYLKTHNLFNIC